MNRREFLFAPALAAAAPADPWWKTRDAGARRIIRIDHATTEWVEGLPLGNGDLGATLYGGPERLTVLFNKANVWDYRVMPGQGFPDNITYDELVDLINRGDWAKADPVFAGFRKAENCSGPSLQPCGQLDLQLLTGERPLNFHQLLDIDNAVAHIHSDFTEYLAGRQALDLRALVPARGAVIPIWASNVPGYNLFGSLRLWRQYSLDFPTPTAWIDGDIAGIDMSIPESVRYTLAVRVVGGDGEWAKIGGEALYTLRPKQEKILLLAAIVTSFESKSPAKDALALLRAAGEPQAAQIEQENRRWWGGFWKRSSVSLPDAALERLWRYGLYLLAAGTQPGKQAPGLQGVWNGYNRPGWHTDYHTDMNVQMCFWPAYAANHIDLTEPYYRLFAVEMIDEARKQAKGFFRRPGAYIPLAPGPKGHELAAPWMWPFGGAWVAQHFWWHYLYTGDLAFLRKYYPFLKEVAAFSEAFFRKNTQGVWDIVPSHCPEMSHPGRPLLRAWGKNSTPDITYSRLLFTALVRASELLDLDAADRKRWIDIRDHLAHFPVHDGRLAPVDHPQFSTDSPGVMVLSPIYPVGEMGLGEPPDKLAFARRSFEASKAKSGGHATVWSAAAAAHVGFGDEAVRLLHSYIDRYVLENGWYLLGPDLRPPGPTKGIMQVDAPIAFSTAVNEMLLQSLDGVIRVFPAVPSNWTAEFETLRATGGFLVSARIDNGVIQWVRIKSERGGAATVQDPFRTGSARVSGSEVRADAKGNLNFETRAGVEYKLTAS